MKANLLLEGEEDKITRSQLENNLGYIYLEEGMYEKAFEYLSRAKSIKKKLGRDDLPNTI